MPKWKYVWEELTGRGRRAWINITLVALAVSLFVLLDLAAGSLKSAFRQPLEDVGADLTIQRAGDVPEKMVGPVLPCSVAPIKKDEISRIRAMDGIISVSPALLFWDFGPKDFQIVAGFDAADHSGFALLRKTLTQGRFPDSGDSNFTLVETSFAQDRHLQPGDQVIVGEKPFKITGIVDASLLSHLAEAQVYLSLAAAREIAVVAPGVTSVHEFGPEDANLLFVKARRDRIAFIQSGIASEMGKGVAVRGPKSFQEMLGSLFAFIDRFSGAVSVLALLTAIILVVRTTLANIQERRFEIGVMKAVGWQGKDVSRQLGAETLVQIMLGGLLGLAVGYGGGLLLSFVEIAIPIPWDMSPRPHFLPGGEAQLYKDVQLTVSMAPGTGLYALGAALAIGLIAAWFGARYITKMKASEALRYE
jgi:putative ABC transport system permease protein